MTIILKTGTHGLVRQARDFYMPTRKDDWSQNLKLIIKSEDPANPVTIRYKLRDKFQLMVGAGLEISDVIFDAIDSVITPIADTGNCLSNAASNCCTLSGTTLSGTGCAFVRTP
jgi:hypothetical protein